VLLSKEPHPIDHLLGAGARGLEASGEAGIFPLEELDALGRNHAFHAGGLQPLEARFRLKRAASKRGELVTEVLDQLLQLTKRRYFRSYAV